MSSFVSAQETAVEKWIGQSAADWILYRTDGSLVQLSKMKGEVVVLFFWATWAGPARLCMPAINNIHTYYKSGQSKQPVRVIGVDTWEQDNKNTKAATYMKQQGFGFDLVLNGDGVATKYNIEGIPTIFVVDQAGIVRMVQVGYDPKLESILKQAIDIILAKN
jgi:peroxiredoxin